MPDYLGFDFGLPFEEAVEAFLAKGIVTRDKFDRFSAEMKAKCFTAAKVYGADELQRVYEAVLAAIEKGQTLRDFAAATENILTSPWHRETVFRTNVLSAYGKGHWEQAQAVKVLRPYARYSAVMDGRTRPQHARLHGLVYPLDDPFWQLYWPPWDYNCRCAAFTLSGEEIASQGLQVAQGMSGDLPAPAKKFFSPARGESWEPDLGKYPPELAAQVGKAIYE